MTIAFYKYHGAGNDFVLIDNRDRVFPKNNQQLINRLCDRHFGIGGDGLILLENDVDYDFNMRYYNADGKEGSLCGNGGRCTVAFAKHLNIIDNSTQFRAIDGLHHATIENGIISLQMADMQYSSVVKGSDYTFLDTGSPHHVVFHPSISDLDVIGQGSKIRYGELYKNEGVNVNFVEQLTSDHLKVRTYERGVENETMACGTGVTACAIAAFLTGKTDRKHLLIDVLGGRLEVSFDVVDNNYVNICLKGPAELVFSGEIDIE